MSTHNKGPEVMTGGEALTKEIERKFLVAELPPEIYLEVLESKKIDQGYLAVDDKGAVRIRKKGNAHFITFKSGPGSHAAERTELETELSAEQFDALWPGTIGRRVEKTRYEIPYGNHTIELDVFGGDNDGRMLAEVEFDTTTAADLFQAPDWLSQDVTSDKRYGNSSIADYGFPAR